MPFRRRTGRTPRARRPTRPIRVPSTSVEAGSVEPAAPARSSAGPRPGCTARRVHVAAARPPRRRRRSTARPGRRSRRRSSPATSGRPSRSRWSSGRGRDATRRARGRRPGRARRRCSSPRDPAWAPRPAAAGGPAVVLVVGVNGTGKTTTIGKLASRYRAEGRSVILAAADTFRAAAIEQLQIWAERAGVPTSSPTPPAPTRARSSTTRSTPRSPAARTSSSSTRPAACTPSSNLMDELAKVRRVIDKRVPGGRRRRCSCSTPRPARTAWPRPGRSTRRSA